MSKGTVLVVDDDRDIRESVQAALESAGYRVLTATGPAVLELASTDRPDLILLDIMMPEPNGLVLSQQLRDTPATADIPIVVMSAHSFVHHNALLPGNDRLPKPFSLEDLYQVVDRWTSGGGHQGAGGHGADLRNAAPQGPPVSAPAAPVPLEAFRCALACADVARRVYEYLRPGDGRLRPLLALLAEVGTPAPVTVTSLGLAVQALHEGSPAPGTDASPAALLALAAVTETADAAVAMLHSEPGNDVGQAARRACDTARRALDAAEGEASLLDVEALRALVQALDGAAETAFSAARTLETSARPPDRMGSRRRGSDRRRGDRRGGDRRRGIGDR